MLFEILKNFKNFRCSDAVDTDGTVKIKIVEQKAGPLAKDDLSSEVFIYFIL